MAEQRDGVQGADEQVATGERAVDGQAADPGKVLREDVEIVLVRPQQAGNVGAVARAMRNMGLRRLTVVAPPAMDIDRARWMSPGATDVLDAARYVPDVRTAIADCHFVIATTARNRHYRWPAFDVEGFVPEAFVAGRRTAILFGPEDSGLGNEDLAFAHALLHIPTDLHASLNLGQAVLLVAAAVFGEARRRGYQPDRTEESGKRGGLARGAAPSAHVERKVVPNGALDPLLKEWFEVLEMATYFKGHEPVLVETTLRQILQRAQLEAHEVVVLRGMLRRFRWRMKNQG